MNSEQHTALLLSYPPQPLSFSTVTGGAHCKIGVVIGAKARGSVKTGSIRLPPVTALHSILALLVVRVFLGE